MIRPQALIAPRPNVRRHPLDRFELEMIDDEEAAYPASVRVAVYSVVLLLCLASWALVIWWLWRLL